MATATASKTIVKPLEDRILVRPNEAEERTKNGIYLPEQAKEKPQMGKVIATGPGKLSEEGVRTPTQVKKGNTVLYGKYSGTEIEIDGEKYLLMRESELLGVVEE